jgi:hypothetical protein
MRLLLATVTLVAASLTAQAVASADEAAEIAAPAPDHDDWRFSVKGFGLPLGEDGVGMVGAEVGVRVARSLELEVDYARLGDSHETIGLLGTSLRWLGFHGNATTYLYTGVATILDLDGDTSPVLRVGVGAEYTVVSGVFRWDGDVYPVPDGHLGVGVHF